MSGNWKNIDATLNDLFRHLPAPSSPAEMAKVLRDLDHPDIASIMERLDDEAYDDVKWRIELMQLNAGLPCGGDSAHDREYYDLINDDECEKEENQT